MPFGVAGLSAWSPGRDARSIHLTGLPENGTNKPPCSAKGAQRTGDGERAQTVEKAVPRPPTKASNINSRKGSGTHNQLGPYLPDAYAEGGPAKLGAEHFPTSTQPNQAKAEVWAAGGQRWIGKPATGTRTVCQQRLGANPQRVRAQTAGTAGAALGKQSSASLCFDSPGPPLNRNS
jgi:hypothetical protein